MFNRITVKNIRNYFAYLLASEQFVIDKTGVKMLEIPSASFVADESMIFGSPNDDYIRRELEWYKSKSLSVYDIPDGPPTIWKNVADKDGIINSNYGWCVWSEENNNQYNKVLAELKTAPNSRRAIMIYTRPTMWDDYNKNGMSDFMCTNAVQYLIRNNQVHSIVQMRSNDIWAGYRNDYAWQVYVLKSLANDLNIESGNIYWNVGSLHCYEKDMYLVDWFQKHGEISVSKKEYRETYPNSMYV